MEMIDEKGYEKKTPDKILPIISVIFITILMVEFYMMEDFSLIIKLLYSICTVWIFIYDFRKKIYCLFNYEEFPMLDKLIAEFYVLDDESRKEIFKIEILTNS